MPCLAKLHRPDMAHLQVHLSAVFSNNAIYRWQELKSKQNPLFFFNIYKPSFAMLQLGYTWFREFMKNKLFWFKYCFSYVWCWQNASVFSLVYSLIFFPLLPTCFFSLSPFLIFLQAPVLCRNCLDGKASRSPRAVSSLNQLQISVL